jgi:AraC-like DNA-binding protein
MHTTAYSLSTLFAQLGLADSDSAIEQFIRQHGSLPSRYRLWEAPCWNTGQAALLREELANDADWAEVIDQLNILLRKPN